MIPRSFNRLKRQPAARRRTTPPTRCSRRGTLDKLRINDHWYSDKPPLVSVPLAVAYRALMVLGLPSPSARPDVFAWVMTVLLSGTGYAVAVGCMWTLGQRAGLSPKWRFAWLAAFALATVLPAYTRSANNHIAQLGAVAAVCVLLCRIADRARRRPHRVGIASRRGVRRRIRLQLRFRRRPAAGTLGVSERCASHAPTSAGVRVCARGVAVRRRGARDQLHDRRRLAPPAEHAPGIPRVAGQPVHYHHDRRRPPATVRAVPLHTRFARRKEGFPHTQPAAVARDDCGRAGVEARRSRSRRTARARRVVRRSGG